ncbi:MAG: integrase [Patescibacteria group bacterium]
MNDDNVVSIAQLREFLKLSNSAAFSRKSADEAYEWIGTTLGKFRYFSESKKNRGLVKRYIKRWTGYSDTQMDRLIRRKRETGRVIKRERTQPCFPRVYTAEDIALIAEVDNAENRRTGGALKKTLSDMYRVYKDSRFERLSRISVAHLYNLRRTRVYESRSLTYTKTQAVSVPIGIRKKPQPEGQPGYLRVDSVHQGDMDKEKGVYHINLVDEVTQDEIVVTVEGISEQYLAPALEEALATFPFVIRGFHSDNGSEYINKVVARLLQRLLIEQTKSRSRKTNDNALAEGKNGSVIRRHFGYMHIPRKYAKLMNGFNREYLNPYLFLHRQCAFADEVVDDKGKIKKVYKTYQTPCEKLLSIPNAEKYLRPGITAESLRSQMMEKTHLAAAKEMQEAKRQLFAKINRRVVQ